MTTVSGFCAPRFARVRALLENRLAAADEVGASVCVIHDERTVVDLWGGLADPEARKRWGRDTVVNTYSLTKTMAALVVLKLVDAEVLDPSAPVARYWPEFARAGKDNVLVRHVLGHTSGVCGWDRPVTLEELYDTPHAAALLAEQQPWWKPGEGSGYQAISHGHLLGELVRRITGTTLGTLLREEFAETRDADYWIGAPPNVDERVAVLVPPPRSTVAGALDPDSITMRTMTNPLVPTAVTTTREFLGAELAGFNGQGNARSVARLQAVVSHGGRIDGVGYLSPATVERVFASQADGVDRVLGARLRFGLGYGLPTPTVPEIPRGRVCWWSGFGGSIVVNDLDRRMTVAYVMNRMEPAWIAASNGRAYVGAVYAALDDADPSASAGG